MYSKIRIKEKYVVIYYTSGGHTMRFKTGVKIDSQKEWNEKKNQLTSKVSDFKEKMKIINLWKTRSDKAINAALEEGYKISGKELQQYLNKHKDGLILSKTTKVSTLFARFHKEKKEELVDNPNRSSASIKDYTSLMRTLTDYENEINKDLTISEIDKAWCKKFEKWLAMPRKDGALTKGKLQSRTIKKRFDVLKSFYRWLEAQELIKNISALTNYKINVANSIIDTLSIDEVRKLSNFTPSSERLNRVKDLFVFACHTGLRWEDIRRARKVHVKVQEGGVTLSKVTHKSRNTTQERLSVPLSETALEIFKKYKYNLDLISHQKANKYLKEVLKETGWYDDEMEKKNKDGNYMKRWEYFSFHDGRRTFITNLVNSAVPVNEIMKYTGHKKISTLQQYIDKTRPTSFNHIKILD
ncbi:MAG: tyrosine-type recombinase/integrase [Flavobacteriaceae bacterium]|nr:tyrosine-type recombinase/integrase [Flavobacteriaceae bacterium]